MKYVFDHDRKTITVDGKVILPTRRSWLIGVYLSSSPGRVRSKLDIMDALEISLHNFDTSVASTVKRARKEGLVAIKTRYAMGYYWEEAGE